MRLQIIFATGNAHKLHEIREIINEMGISEDEVSLRSMKEAEVAADPEENGSTFEENALIKAGAVARKVEAAVADAASGFDYDPAVPLVVMSDDSGLCIDALNGEPGIHSARFMGHDTDYTIKMNAIMDMMRTVPDEQRTARFVAAVASVFPDLPANADINAGTYDAYTAIGVMEGAIAHSIKGVNGFGYDPFFYLPQYGCSSAEILPEDKNAISHRGQALRAMMSRLLGENGLLA